MPVLEVVIPVLEVVIPVLVVVIPVLEFVIPVFDVVIPVLEIVIPVLKVVIPVLVVVIPVIYFINIMPNSLRLSVFVSLCETKKLKCCSPNSFAPLRQACYSTDYVKHSLLIHKLFPPPG